jgi:hypothetical protein
MVAPRAAPSGFRAHRRKRRFYRYEELHSADRWHPGRRVEADAILRGDWQWKGHGSVALDPPVDWDGLCAENRSWSLALHSWEPLAVLLAAHQHGGDCSYFDFALEVALDWLERFSSVTDESSHFAWYDLAVGTRAYRIAYLLDVVARDPHRDEEVVALLLDGLRLHAAALSDDTRFADHSNHGFYQVMGQMAMARRFPDLPEIAAAGVQASERLNVLLDSQFTVEGVHREHSPHYHDLVLIPLRALQRAGLVEDSQVKTLCEKIEEALAWFVTPAGRYAMFGDTTRQLVTRPNPDQLATATLRFALSEGRTGEPPDACTQAFPESGYVVFRDRWPDGERDFADCSYLAQTCAFHSRVHKHADDLSFVWYDRGCDIFTDAGRFGYVGKTQPDSELFAEGFWYSDPGRIYVESTCAHNTVEVDGRSNPRRGVKPYGSALTQWGKRGEIRFAESRVSHGNVSHVRVLLFVPRLWLLVVDCLSDSELKDHDFVQRFHLAPELVLIHGEGRDGGSISVGVGSGPRLHPLALLPQTPIEPIRGTQTPQLMGWISPRDRVLEPQWTFGWEATGTPSQTFASLFCFANEPPNVDPSENEANADASMARLSWHAGKERHSLVFERVLGQSFEVEHSSIRLPDEG